MLLLGKDSHIETLNHAFDHVQIGLALIDETTVIERVNPAGNRILGRQPDELVGTRFVDLVHEDDLRPSLVELKHLLERGYGGPIIVRIRRTDGSWASIRAHATLLPGDRRVGFVVFEDVTGELEVAEALRTAEAGAARRAGQQEAVAEVGRVALSGAAPEVVTQRACELIVDTLGADHAAGFLDDEHPDGLLQVAGAGEFTEFVGVFRWPRIEGWIDVLRRRRPLFIDDLADGDPKAPLTGFDHEVVAQSGLRSVVVLPIVATRAPPGSLVASSRTARAFNRGDATFLEALANVVASSLDSTTAFGELRHQALHDTLTGLPNRALLLDHLERVLEESRRHRAQVAVFVCDLDRFKVVNDGLGHAVGDAVLRTVAERLTQHVRPGDLVGRFGGDEFVVVCPNVRDLPTVVGIAERLSAAIAEPVDIAGHQLVVSGSLGIALGHHAGADAAAALLRDADAAMYRAKSHGRSRYELYDDTMRAIASRRLQVETDLRRALAEDELVLHYQPVVTAVEGDLVGVEALVRWQHPDRGLVPPAEFLGVAEESGLLPALGHHVLQLAATQAAAWSVQPGWPRHWVAVNLHVRELVDPALLRRVDAVLGDTGVDPHLLRVEITEDALLEDTVETASVLDALRRRGISISIDDFGTGYSSLAYLKRLPVDSLKLDRVFVAGLGHDPSAVSDGDPIDEVDDTAIASAVVQMAAALHLQVVAEGVEREEQLEVLRRLGCDQVQGYLIGHPMPADELADWIADRAALRS